MMACEDTAAPRGGSAATLGCRCRDRGEAAGDAAGPAGAAADRDRGLPGAARIKAAEGDATATIAAAKGQAEANRLLAASLTQPILTQRLIDRLGPEMKVITLPSAGAGNLFDLSRLVK
jgi:hypothetical protein